MKDNIQVFGSGVTYHEVRSHDWWDDVDNNVWLHVWGRLRDPVTQCTEVVRTLASKEVIGL